MCGRTICMLAPGDIQKACAYRGNSSSANDGKSNSWTQPRWRTHSSKQQYNPSYNIAPGACTPVLLSGKHFADDEVFKSEERVIQPMTWGLIPSWHKGQNAFSLNTNNCRTETFLKKPIFKNPIEKGRRCVVVCEGYYEWKSDGKTKQPYLIHRIQDENISIHDEKWHRGELEDSWNEMNGWTGPRLLFMAGVFDICTKDEDTSYSYSVLTMPASETMSWLHQRMPVILESEEAIANWLNFESLPITKVMHLITSPKEVKWYAISDTVNNSRNNVAECIIPCDLIKPKVSAESKMMMMWLKKGSKNSQSLKRSSDEGEQSVKKIKI